VKLEQKRESELPNWVRLDHHSGPGDRVAQLDLLDDDRAHVVLELYAPGAWPWCWRPWRILAQVLELALCQVHHPVSEPLLELRAPLVRHLLQMAEPARRVVPLTLLLELRGQLVLLDRTPL